MMVHSAGVYDAAGTSSALYRRGGASMAKQTCRLVHAGGQFEGKQGFAYEAGVSAQTAGAQGICLHMLTIPPGKRGKAHLHESHETAIYTLSGEIETWYGEGLTQHLVSRAGDFLYIPAGCPHLPANLTDEPAVCLIART